MEIHSIWDTKQCLDVVFHQNYIVLIILRFKLLRSSFYNILWQFFTICDQKPYHLESPYGSVFVCFILSQKSQVFYHEKNWHEASWEILQNFPIWEILHWCKERRIKRKKKKILHVWNELSTQDWTTLRFVLGNIWGLTLAKVFVKKFFLKFIHPNRHTHHGVCFSLLPHLKPYPSTKKLLYKGSYKTVLF